MAVDLTPSALFGASYSSDGTNITIPISAIQGLTAGEAHATTGDWREIFYGMNVTAFLHYINLPVADRPQGYKTTPPTRYAVESGALSGTFRETFQHQFWNEYAYGDVVDEP